MFSFPECLGEYIGKECPNGEKSPHCDKVDDGGSVYFVVFFGIDEYLR